MNPGILIGTMLFQIISGFSDREIVENLSAQDRERLEAQFGDINEFIASLSNMTEEAGLPNVGIGDIPGAGAQPPGTLEEAAASGQNYTFNQDGNIFTGNISQNSSGSFLLSSGLTDHPTPIEMLPDGSFSFGGGSTPFSITQDDGAAFRNIFASLEDSIPDFGSVMDGVEIPEFNPQDTIDQIEESLGGFLQPGDLGRIDPQALIASLNIQAPDFDSIASNALSTLRTDVQDTATRQGSEAQQSLAASGILPGSAAFETQTRLQPQSDAEFNLDVGGNAIEADIAGQQRDFELERSGLEANARLQAETINTQRAGIENASRDAGISALSGLFTNEAGFGLQGAELQLGANEQDISNQFQQFAAQYQVTQGALDQFNTFLTANTQLNIAGKSIVAQLMQVMVQAELSQSDSTILTTEIMNNAINSAFGIFNGIEDAFGNSGSGGDDGGSFNAGVGVGPFNFGFG